jgi:hypothetical protein
MKEELNRNDRVHLGPAGSKRLGTILQKYSDSAPASLTICCPRLILQRLLDSLDPVQHRCFGKQVPAHTTQQRNSARSCARAAP